MFSSFAEQRHLRYRPYALVFLIWRVSYSTQDIPNSLVCTLGFRLGLHLTMWERLTRTYFTANTPDVANICSWFEAIARFLNQLFIIKIRPRTIGFSAPHPSKFGSLGFRRVNGSMLYGHISTLPGCTEYFARSVFVNIWLTLEDIQFRFPPQFHYANSFDADYTPIFTDSFAHKPWMIFRHTMPYCINWGPIPVLHFRPCVIYYLQRFLPGV